MTRPVVFLPGIEKPLGALAQDRLLAAHNLMWGSGGMAELAQSQVLPRCEKVMGAINSMSTNEIVELKSRVDFVEGMGFNAVAGDSEEFFGGMSEDAPMESGELTGHCDYEGEITDFEDGEDAVLMAWKSVQDANLLPVAA